MPSSSRVRHRTFNDKLSDARPWTQVKFVPSLRTPYLISGLGRVPPNDPPSWGSPDQPVDPAQIKMR
jgi:hypothetical protein